MHLPLDVTVADPNVTPAYDAQCVAFAAYGNSLLGFSTGTLDGVPPDARFIWFIQFLLAAIVTVRFSRSTLQDTRTQFCSCDITLHKSLSNIVHIYFIFNL